MNQRDEYLQGMPLVTGSSVMSKEVYQSPKSPHLLSGKYSAKTVVLIPLLYTAKLVFLQIIYGVQNTFNLSIYHAP